MTMMAAVYPQPLGLTGEDRVYGTFPNQRIFGYACSIRIDKLLDSSKEAKDMLGVCSFRIGEPAMHISGLNPYGEMVRSLNIQAIGMYEILWNTPYGKKPHGLNMSMGGMGCDGPEPCVIVGGDYHHAMYSACDYFVTLRGLHSVASGYASFAPLAICQMIDRLHPGRLFKFADQERPQHIRAVRRLIEDAVKHKTEIDGDMVVRRFGTWNYRWVKHLNGAGQ